VRDEWSKRACRCLRTRAHMCVHVRMCVCVCVRVCACVCRVWSMRVLCVKGDLFCVSNTFANVNASFLFVCVYVCVESCVNMKANSVCLCLCICVHLRVHSSQEKVPSSSGSISRGVRS